MERIQIMVCQDEILVSYGFGNETDSFGSWHQLLWYFRTTLGCVGALRNQGITVFNA